MSRTDISRDVSMGENVINSKNDLPLITVYMPTHNRRMLLERAVNSVLSQTYEKIELIIVDDGSEDDTWDYLLNIPDERVRVIRNPEARGACFARNIAIAQAGGEFITGLDDDDYFEGGHIQELIDKWNCSSESVVAVYSNNLKKTDLGLKRSRSKPKACVAEDLIYCNWIGNQVITKTKYLRDISGFNESLPAWQDLDCWYRLLKHTGGVAERKSGYTYVLDLSHPHERISGKNKNKIEVAWSIFCDSNNLSREQREISRLLLNLYGFKILSFKFILKKVFGLPRIYNFRHALVILYFSVFRNK